MSVNAARGEVELLIGDQSHRLCLTLGALAEIETLFEGDEALGNRLKRLSARDVLAVLLVLLRGGGSDITEDDLRASPLDLNEAARAIAACFEAAL